MKPLRMSLLLCRTATTAALLLASAGASAQAATVFDQTSPFTVNKTDGNRGDLWSADDFGVSASSMLSGATAYLGYYSTDGVIPGINYTLYADNGGKPGTILQSGSATPTDTVLGTAGGNFDWHAWTFDFTAPIEALADTRYWLGLQQGSDRVSIGFIDSGNPDATALTTFAGPTPENYNIPLPRGLAFSIQSTAIDLPGAVPEPATWAMMIVGFGAVGGAMRRRSRATVRFA